MIGINHADLTQSYSWRKKSWISLSSILRPLRRSQNKSHMRFRIISLRQRLRSRMRIEWDIKATGVDPITDLETDP